MLKTMTAAFAIAIALVASPASAQCTLGVYAEEDGTGAFVSPIVQETFDVYVVMFLEGLATGVGYTLDITGGQDLLPIGASYGSGGLNFPNDPANEYFGGSNVGLGECAVGFNGRPIVVAQYTFLALGVNGSATFGLSGNAGASDLDPAGGPVFSTCAGEIQYCGVGPALTIETPVNTEQGSFGAVKGLFSN